MKTEDFLHTRIQVLEKELKALQVKVEIYTEELYDAGLLNIGDPHYNDIDNQRYQEYLQSSAEVNESLEIT
jgi:hypothetical protein